MVETKLEHILTNSYRSDMISYMKSHPEDFVEAIKLAIAELQRMDLEDEYEGIVFGICVNERKTKKNAV